MYLKWRPKFSNNCAFEFRLRLVTSLSSTRFDSRRCAAAALLIFPAAQSTAAAAEIEAEAVCRC